MPDTTASALKPGDHVFLVDGSSFVFRAYFQSINQDAKYNYRSDGLPTGALRLFATKLYQFILEGAVGIRPTHLAIIFDKTEQTFRKEIYADYKANRREPPDDLMPQFPLMREAVKAFGLTPIEKAGFEADDIIATYASEAAAAGADVLLISSDKDLMQLVSDKIQFYDFESGLKGRPGYRPERKIDIAGVIDYFGVPPEKVIDVQALVGDTSDNVPGVPGIGVKTASQLIIEYGDLETLLAKAPEIKQPKRREALIAYADQARLSKRLVTLDCHVEIGTPLDATRTAALDPKRLLAFLKAMELTTITKRVAEASGIDAATIEADPNFRAKPKEGGAPAAGFVSETGPDGQTSLVFGDGVEGRRPPAGQSPPGTGGGAAGNVGGATGALGQPVDLAAARAVLATAIPIDTKVYETVTSLERLDAWIAEATERGRRRHRRAYDRLGRAAMRADRHQPRHPAGQGGLHPVRPPERRRRSPRRAGARPDPIGTGARAAEAALRGPFGPENLARPQGRLSLLPAPRHRDRADR